MIFCKSWLRLGTAVVSDLAHVTSELQPHWRFWRWLAPFQCPCYVFLNILFLISFFTYSNVLLCNNSFYNICCFIWLKYLKSSLHSLYTNNFWLITKAATPCSHWCSFRDNVYTRSESRSWSKWLCFVAEWSVNLVELHWFDEIENLKKDTPFERQVVHVECSGFMDISSIVLFNGIVTIVLC